eukprot:scaffold82721_cov28-Tisochrysis_lutea.AAC.1
MIGDVLARSHNLKLYVEDHTVCRRQIRRREEAGLISRQSRCRAHDRLGKVGPEKAVVMRSHAHGYGEVRAWR